MDDKYEKANSLGERLYILREKHSLSQDELAEKLNVSRQTISNWENDKVKLDVGKATELCSLFGVGMDELLLGREQKREEHIKSKRTGVGFVMALIALVIAVSMGIAAGICMALSSNAETSSVIYLNAAAGWGIVLCCCAVTVIILVCLILKYRKK